jgi:hypothetical protein
MTLKFPDNPAADAALKQALKTPLKRTLFDVPLELSLDAPTDKIVIHPDLLAHFDRMTFKPGTYVQITEILEKP